MVDLLKVSLLPDDAECLIEPPDSSAQCRWPEVEAARPRARKETGGETSFGRLMRTSSGHQLNYIMLTFHNQGSV